MKTQIQSSSIRGTKLSVLKIKKETTLNLDQLKNIKGGIVIEDHVMY